jgi:hypothetical protein
VIPLADPDVLSLLPTGKVDVVREHLPRLDAFPLAVAGIQTTASASAAQVTRAAVAVAGVVTPNVDRPFGISVENSSKYGSTLLSNRDADSVADEPPATNTTSKANVPRSRRVLVVGTGVAIVHVVRLRERQRLFPCAMALAPATHSKNVADRSRRRKARSAWASCDLRDERIGCLAIYRPTSVLMR